jgi:phosphatidylinositol alpha-mannosyltransferase
MRILVTCDWFSPGTGGGAERVAYEVTRRLARDGHDVTVLATRPPGDVSFDAIEGVRVESVGAIDLSRLVRVQVSVAPALARATGRVLARVQPDLVWAHSLQFQTTPFAALAARRAGIPFVVSAHIGDLRGVTGLTGVAARFHESTVGRAILRHSTRVIGVSAAVADHVRTLAPAVPVDVVPNGVDLDRFRPVEAEPSNTFRIGYLGRLVRNKGPETAVRALIELRRRGLPARLLVAGDGLERASMQALAAAAGVSEHVRFDGFRPDPEHWFGTIDALIRPSLTEGMPLGLLEALATGVPVVASDIPGNRSLITDGTTGFLAPARDPDRFADALERLAREPALRMRFREAGIAMTASMTWDRSAALTAASFNRALTDVERHPAGRRKGTS